MPAINPLVYRTTKGIRLSTPLEVFPQDTRGASGGDLGGARLMLWSQLSLLGPEEWAAIACGAILQSDDSFCIIQCITLRCCLWNRR